MSKSEDLNGAGVAEEDGVLNGDAHKKCLKCGRIKPLTAFPADGRTLDGHRQICERCYSESASAKISVIAPAAPTQISVAKPAAPTHDAVDPVIPVLGDVVARLPSIADRMRLVRLLVAWDKTGAKSHD